MSDLQELATILHRGVAFHGVQFEVYKASVRAVWNVLSTWCYNRMVREDHVQRLYDELRSMKHPHLMGSIKVVSDTNSKELRVIDGQHRLLAMGKILMEDIGFQWDSTVFLEVYYVSSIQDVNSVKMLFEKANANLNVVENDIPKMEIVEIIEAMYKDPILNPERPKGVRNIVDHDKRVYRPRITKKSLKDAFDAYFHPPDPQSWTPERVVLRVRQINHSLSMRSVHDLFGSSGDLSWRRLKAAHDIRFYLNMESNFPPSVWIPKIWSCEPQTNDT